MAELKSYTCPNCGANTTNADNCEYCGSLLVRFVEKRIDISQTYLDDTETFPGLINALKLNLQLQENNEEDLVVTDIVGPVTVNDKGRGDIGCVLRNGYICFMDHSPVPSKSKDGICISFAFAPYLDDENAKEFNTIVEAWHKRFKTLDCYPLFMERICFYTDEYGSKRKCYEHFIDFGKDAEGAARLISKVWKEVFEIPFDANIEYYTNVGSDNIDKARKTVNAELYGEAARDGTEEKDDDDDDFPSWTYWVVALITLVLFKMCA